MQENPSPVRWIKVVAIGLALSVLGIVVGAVISQQQAPRDATTPSASGTESVLSEPRALQPFQLSVEGKPQFSNDDLRGQWTFLFFGYSHCPDVCPTTLAELARVYALLEQEPGALENTRFVFVSVDPARDTPKMLATYAGYFNPTFVGVTGETDQLAALAQQMNIRFRRGAGSDEAYSVDHSSAVLLIDPQVRYHARFRAPHHAQDIRTQFLDIRRQYEARQRTQHPG